MLSLGLQQKESIIGYGNHIGNEEYMFGSKTKILNSLYKIQIQTTMSIKKHSIDLSSASSTECDSSQETDDPHYFSNFLKTNPLKYKTQMCKKFSTLGYCNYGDKCKFAHGFHQLVRLPTNQHFRKKKCSKYWNQGTCPYGARCQFGHCQVESETISYLKAVESIQCKETMGNGSRLLKLLKQ